MTQNLPEIGARIRLIEMPNDPCPVEPGTLGTVSFVNETVRQMGVKWDSGRSLIVVLGTGTFEIVTQHRVALIDDNSYARYEILVKATDADQAAGIAREMVVNGVEAPQANGQYNRDDALPYVTDVIDAQGEERAFGEEHGHDGVVVPDLLKARDTCADAIESIDDFAVACERAQKTDTGDVWELLSQLREVLFAALPKDMQQQATQYLADLTTQSEAADLGEIVRANLKAAEENGDYEDLDTFTATDVVNELLAFASDCYDREPADLLPHVETWIAARKAERDENIAADHAQHQMTVSA